MSRRRSVINLPLISTALLLFVGISEARPSFRWTEGDKNIEDSITSEIRKLEHIRREIVESSSLKEQEIRRDISGINGQPKDSGHSIYSAGAAAPKGGNSLAVRSTETRHPRRQVDPVMYQALSKLANIQVADSRIHDLSRSRSSQDESGGRSASRSKFHDRMDGEGANGDFMNFFEPSRTPKKETTTTTERSSTESRKVQYAPRKFHCYPIREIYIPKVEKKMPAYACSLGKRAFVISSERFIQDSRDHFEVNVDESTFRRLTPMTSGVTTLTSGVSVLPATLVLKQGEDGYTVRGVNANWKEARATANGDN